MPVAGIKVVTVGKAFPLPYDVRHVDDSAQIMGTIAQFMPDVVVTSTFIPGVLSQTHFEIRKRWINVDPSASIEAICQAIENCYNFNLWTVHHYQKDNPLISVYTPTFNTGDYLAETYRSLKEQTYSNWEWVVIDDHSTDRTWERLEDMAKEDVRVRPFRMAKRTRRRGCCGWASMVPRRRRATTARRRSGSSCAAWRVGTWRSSMTRRRWRPRSSRRSTRAHSGRTPK